jgi:hypothetical protein
MKTIALRFAENFAPSIGTIASHQIVIDALGYVWYGKLGTPISNKSAELVLNNSNPRILLIHSGKQKRYWAHITDITRKTPDLEAIPEYYRDESRRFKVWFKVYKFEEASREIMSHCFVSSTKAPLSIVSKSSMSPYFIIDVNEEQ